VEAVVAKSHQTPKGEMQARIRLGAAMQFYCFALQHDRGHSVEESLAVEEVAAISHQTPKAKEVETPLWDSTLLAGSDGGRA
jgi:hypothetical protein